MDNDIIAYLVPHEGSGFKGANDVVGNPQNQARVLPARSTSTANVPSQQDSGRKEPPFEQDCLVLRFSHGARSPVGVVMGSNPSADIFVPAERVSAFHLAFTFDKQHRLMARDLGSSGGTKVTYSGEVAARVSDSKWLMRVPSILGQKPPILSLTKQIQFEVVVPHCDTTQQDYIDKVKKFGERTTDPNLQLESLRLANAKDTQLPTKGKTPVKGSLLSPLLYRKLLGQGGFGIVHYEWNAVTGDEYAVKEPRPDLIEGKSFDRKDWENEAAMMGRISHRHIVEFRGATLDPWPRLEFEYVPGGSLERYSSLSTFQSTSLSTFQSTQVLRQISSALEYLHTQQPPIAHRDVKPANILVDSEGPNDISVKFADFGLSKAAEWMNSECGTKMWAAPGIFDKTDRPYGVNVDIWSLGLVVASLRCELPSYGDGQQWKERVQQRVKRHSEKQGSDLLSFIASSMLVEEDLRLSASRCHVKALELERNSNSLQHQESNDETKEDSVTQEPCVLVARSSAEPKNADSDASTVRPHIQSVSAAGSETRIRDSVDFLNPSLIGNPGCHEGSPIGSLVTGTESEGWRRSSASDCETASSHVPGTTSMALPQCSTTDGLLQNSEAVSLTDKHIIEASEDGCGPPQVDDHPTERDSISSIIGHPHSDDVTESRTDANGSRTEELGRKGKRARSVDASPLVSPTKSSTHLHSGAQQLAVNGDISSSKKLHGPDPKRTKRGE